MRFNESQSIIFELQELIEEEKGYKRLQLESLNPEGAERCDIAIRCYEIAIELIKRRKSTV